MKNISRRFIATAMLLTGFLFAFDSHAGARWEQLLQADLGDIVFANQNGFAAFHAGNKVLSYVNPNGSVYKSVSYPTAGTGTVTIFPDGWAAEVIPASGIALFDATGAVVKQGAFSSVLGEQYAPTTVRKLGDIIFAESASGLVQLNVTTWLATVFPGGVMPGPEWADSSYQAIRRIAPKHFPTYEEVYITRISIGGQITASYSYPVTQEAFFCLIPEYPTTANQIAISMGTETVLLDRLTLTEVRRLHYGSCAPKGMFTRSVQMQALSQSTPLWITTSGSHQFNGNNIGYGDYNRYDYSYDYSRGGSVISEPGYTNQWFWDGMTKVYSVGPSVPPGTGYSPFNNYGVYYLDQTQLRLVADLISVDFNNALDLSLTSLIDGGKPPYTCSLAAGSPSWLSIQDCTLHGINPDSYLHPITGGVGVSVMISDSGGDVNAANLTLVQNGSSATPQSKADVVEFYNSQLKHYFLTINAFEIANILAGSAGPGWSKTGRIFKGWLPNSAGGLPDYAYSSAVEVCRFYGTPGAGPNSHFYTLAGEECTATQSDPGWLWEKDNRFYLLRPTIDSKCAPGTTPVYRAYNNGFATNDSNHRYSTDLSVLQAMIPLGWSVEGVAMCAPQ